MCRVYASTFAGCEADQARDRRGTVERGASRRREHTSYVGSHYVDVYVVKNGVCVARDRQRVIIQPRAAAA
jgi:hypothetical protein